MVGLQHGFPFSAPDNTLIVIVSNKVLGEQKSFTIIFTRMCCERAAIDYSTKERGRREAAKTTETDGKRTSDDFT